MLLLQGIPCKDASFANQSFKHPLLPRARDVSRHPSGE
jgi:hypothetical protein